jgi:hypothetical protein
MDIITETIPIGIKAIVKALSRRCLLNFQKYRMKEGGSLLEYTARIEKNG